RISPSFFCCFAMLWIPGVSGYSSISSGNRVGFAPRAVRVMRHSTSIEGGHSRQFTPPFHHSDHTGFSDCPARNVPYTKGRMNDKDDWQLLREYAQNRSDDAFQALVQRHLDSVHSAALRQVRDRHLAEDATPATCTALSRKAP